MISDFKNWLLKPYPLPTKTNLKILISFGIGIFISGFLYVFQPFNYYKLTNDEIINYSLIYGIITTSSLLFNYFVLPLVFKPFFVLDKWNIYKMILFVLIIIISIGVLNWFFSGFSSFNTEDNEYDFLFFQKTAFLVGVFPLLIYIYFTEKFIYKKNKAVADNISSLKKQNPIDNKNKKSEGIVITLIGDNKKEALEISLTDLIYVNSEKNYASIFHQKDGTIKESLLRISLSKIEKQLADYSCIVRCHRSYIVNTNKVKKIQGNARGYLLKIDNSTTLIPVSRRFPKELLFTLVN